MAAAVGLVTIGFGIPINAFSLGNTLIISGTIAVASGLILIGLALILGQLRRIAEALRGKALARAPDAVESSEAVTPASPRDAGAGRDPALDPRIRRPQSRTAHARTAMRRSPAFRPRPPNRRPVRWIGCVPNPSP